MFPLATSLFSTISAGQGPLFDGFSGTTDVSDFSAARAAGLWLLIFPAPPGTCASGTAEISQFLCKGPPTARDQRAVAARAVGGRLRSATAMELLARDATVNEVVVLQ